MGTTSWTTLATVTTAGDGTLDPSQAVTPQAHTRYRLRHPATPFYAAGTSSTATVLVGVRLTARADPHRPRDDHGRPPVSRVGRPIWNNDGDTATLIDPHNIVVSRYHY